MPLPVPAQRFGARVVGEPGAADEQPRRQVPFLPPEFAEPPHIRGRGEFLRRLDVEGLADDLCRAIAILHLLDPAKDFLGVWLADAEGTHGGVSANCCVGLARYRPAGL